MKRYNTSITHLFIIILTSLLLASCGMDLFGTGEDKQITFSFSKDEKESIEVNNRFAADLLDIYYEKAGTPYDYTLSPVSIQLFLGMLNSAASDDVSSKITGMLGYEDKNADHINSFCKKLIEETPKIDPETTIGLVNQWWLNSARGFSLYDDFSKILKEVFSVKPESHDFTSEQIEEIIHDWIMTHTREMIDVRPIVLDSSTCEIANASYFKSEWKNKFGENNTRSRTFNIKEGVTIEQEFMVGEFKEIEYLSTDIFESVFLPFGNGSFEMMVLLPAKDIKDVIGWLKDNEIPSKRDKYAHQIFLPKFDILSPNMELFQDLYNKYGVVLTCQDNNTKYPRAGKTSDNKGMEVRGAGHIARTRIDESGAEAAAVTITVSSGMGPDASKTEPKYRIFDASHPFVFMIRERKSGVVLFNGIYGGGLASEVIPPYSL